MTHHPSRQAGSTMKTTEPERSDESQQEGHAIVYEGGAGRILLTVPWGHHSGRIPPPLIKFYAGGSELVFAYVGGS